MMIAFITIKSSLVPLIEGLCAHTTSMVKRVVRIARSLRVPRTIPLVEHGKYPKTHWFLEK